jgi:hypothetical protein
MKLKAIFFTLLAIALPIEANEIVRYQAPGMVQQEFNRAARRENVFVPGSPEAYLWGHKIRQERPASSNFTRDNACRYPTRRGLKPYVGQYITVTGQVSRVDRIGITYSGVRAGSRPIGGVNNHLNVPQRQIRSEIVPGIERGSVHMLDGRVSCYQRSNGTRDIGLEGVRIR